MLPAKGELLKLIIQGDRRCFEKFFYELFPKLYRFSYDFVKDKDIARDIAHESFIKLWETRFFLQPDSNLESYLITICRNKCLNFLKHKKVILHYQSKTQAENAEQEMFTALLSEDNFSGVDFNLLIKKVTSSVRNLPEQCRKVFELSRFKKKKYSEIATILNISHKTVEAHISLALRKLKEDLKEFL